MTPRRIPLTEAEAADLMSRAVDNPIVLQFGPSGVFLDTVKSSWAVPLLMEWRGETVSNGGGI